jgi:hypothetical protein
MGDARPITLASCLLPSLESLAASFDRVLNVEGKPERTRVLYGQSVHYFCAWLAVHGQAADLSSFTRGNVLGWLKSLRQRGLNDGTILTRWRKLVTVATSLDGSTSCCGSGSLARGSTRVCGVNVHAITCILARQIELPPTPGALAVGFQQHPSGG